VKLADFLSYKGISLEDILEEAKERLHLASGDVLVLCGSLVEGLGNQKSDLDLILITDRQDIQFTSLNDVVLIVNKCFIDIQVVHYLQMEQLLDRFNHWVGQPHQPRLAKAFAFEERRLLHRLCTGRCLFGDARFAEVKFPLRSIDLARHLLDFASYNASTLQVDLAGLRAAADPYSVLFVAQALLGYAMDALLAGHHFTNPNWRWRVGELRRLPKQWEQKLPGRQSEKSAEELYWSLHRAPDSTGINDIHNHALRIVAFSRRVFSWAEYQLLSPSLPPIPTAQCTSIVSNEPLPHLDLDVTVRYRDSNFELLRLQGDGQIFRLSAQEYSLLCLFDGETSKDFAAEYAARLWGRTQGENLVEEMETLVRYGKLEATDCLDEQALSALLGTKKPTWL
jgi:hypothetical protein